MSTLVECFSFSLSRVSRRSRPALLACVWNYKCMHMNLDILVCIYICIYVCRYVYRYMHMYTYLFQTRPPWGVGVCVCVKIGFENFSLLWILHCGTHCNTMRNTLQHTAEHAATHCITHTYHWVISVGFRFRVYYVDNGCTVNSKGVISLSSLMWILSR